MRCTRSRVLSGVPSHLPDNWIELSIPEVSTEGRAEDYGEPVTLPRGGNAPAPPSQESPAHQIVPPDMEPLPPEQQPSLAAPPRAAPWKRELFVAALQIGAAGLVYYGAKVIDRWWARRRE